MIGQAPISPITGCPGWLSNAEEALLMRYAQQLHASDVIVNIGCEYGRSLIALAKAAPDAKVYGVELAPKTELHSNLLEAGLYYSLIIEGDSKAVGKEWTQKGDTVVHLLFVDGAHEYENVVGDIEAWYPHIALNGYIIFHDVAQITNQQPHYLHFEVTRAITEWVQSQSDFEAIEQADSIAVFRRVSKNESDFTGVIATEDASCPIPDDFQSPEIKADVIAESSHYIPEDSEISRKLSEGSPRGKSVRKAKSAK